MKNIIQLILFVFVFQITNGQTTVKELEKNIESDFTDFPKSTIKIWTRSRNVFNPQEVGVLENGIKAAQVGVKNLDSAYKPIPRNKYVLILVQNHYQSKGAIQRYFFKSVLSQGLSGKIKKGDKYLIATFDWYRNGKYLFFPGGTNFTDDFETLYETIGAISSPGNLSNTQQGSDIYNAIDEGLKFFSNIKDTIPKNILLLSDDFPNIVSNVQPSTIAEKSVQMDIPIYGISHNMGYSRYNLIMQNQICDPSNGDYFLSGNNDPDEAGTVLGSFVNDMNRNSLGIFRTITFTSNVKKTGEKLPIKVELKDYPVRDFEVRYPFNLLEWIQEKPLLFVLCIAGLVILVSLIVFLFKKIKKRKELTLSRERELAENQKRSQTEIQMLQNQQQQLTAKYEDEKSAMQRKLQDEQLTRKLDLLGLTCQLVYTYDNKSTVIPMKGIHFTVGRLPSNNLSIDLPFISKTHLKIEFNENGAFYVTDLNSTNGTLLNNIRINTAEKLNNGDIISIGKVDIKFSQIKARP